MYNKLKILSLNNMKRPFLISSLIWNHSERFSQALLVCIMGVLNANNLSTLKIFLGINLIFVNFGFEYPLYSNPLLNALVWQPVSSSF